MSFSAAPYVQDVLRSWVFGLLFQIFKWISIRSLSLNGELMDSIYKKIIISSLCSLCYHIWRTQNEAIWLFKMSTVDNVVERIKC